MWSIFSRDPAKDFAYTIGERVSGLEEKSVWFLHQGKKKSNGEAVSIFVFDVKSSSESQIALAKSSFKRIKTLRHPNILTFLDGIETDKVIYIATEPVTPLEVYLQNNDSSQRQTQLGISWGLHKVAKGLSFLINDCNLIHNNVCMSSIFVDHAGEWKLGGLDYVYPATGPECVPPVKILPYLERYDPPEKADLRRGITGENWSSDMWGLGCLIWEVFNGPLPRTSALKSFGKIPKTLVPNYCELVSANPSSRPNPAKFIQDCCRQGGFMNNPFIKTMLFLEEIQIKDTPEKAKFFQNLTNAVDSFPTQLSKNKILPQLLNAYEFGNCGSMVLAPLFKVGKILDHDDYQNKIVPCVVKLFSSSDRNTRVKLLQQIDQFIEHIQTQVVNDKIFPNIVSGFMDTNPVVRESTIKAMLFIAPKLNYKNLNEELMKHFARLQSKDDQGGIRTNTTICLGKIASHLNPQTRQRILCSAFLRAIKDPFPPARQAGIIGMAVTQSLYTLADICQKLMPPLCTLLMDPEKNVRDQAFKTLKGFMERLEKVSENPELQEEMEKDVLRGGSMNTTAAGWAGWAMGGVSSLTSKVYNKATKTKSPAGANKVMSGTSNTTQSNLQSNPNTQPPSTDLVADQTQEDETAEDEGWDDNEDWGDIEVPPSSQSGMKSNQSSQRNTSNPSHTTDNDDDDDDFGGDDGWDDDGDWGSLEDTTPKQESKSRVSEKSSASSHSSGVSDKISNKQTNSEWGWDEDSSTNTASYFDNKPAKGALRLGGPKKAPVEDFGWIEEEFAPIEDNSVKPASAYDWGSGGTTDDDFFSMATSNIKNTKSKATKSASSSNRSTPARESPPRNTQSKSKITENQSSAIKQKQSNNSKTGSDVKEVGGGDDFGWNDDGGWNDDSWGSTSESKETEADRKKREREEKRQQRQQELAMKREAKKGGAMKLGVKKAD